MTNLNGEEKSLIKKRRWERMLAFCNRNCSGCVYLPRGCDKFARSKDQEEKKEWESWTEWECYKESERGRWEECKWREGREHMWREAVADMQFLMPGLFLRGRWEDTRMRVQWISIEFSQRIFLKINFSFILINK